MRGPALIAGLLLASALVAPSTSAAWVNGGLGIVYGGPYAWGSQCPPPAAYLPPAYYPQPPVAYWPPTVYAAPPAYWPSYGPDVAVRWNRYFAPDGPRVQGYTLPR